MYPSLSNSAPKKLETPHLYNYVKDERYELDLESFEFLRRCTGRNNFEDILSATSSDADESEALLEYLTGEECLVDRSDVKAPLLWPVEDTLTPSLRYLQLHITERCNLDCGHCYLGVKEQKDLEERLIKKTMDEFSPNGLKVLITGGEPLLHRKIWDVLELMSRYPVHRVIFSNGTLISEDVARRLSRYVHGIQISLDGMKEGHEQLRGKGTFNKTIKGIENARKYLDVTVATMVHSRNLGEFEALEERISELGIKEWSLDVPSTAGNADADVVPPYDVAAGILKRYGYGSGVHEGDGSYSCGSHICTVDVLGGVSKCSFFEDAVGNIVEEHLSNLWMKVVDKYTPLLSSLACRGCSLVSECRGGCRFRAMSEGDFYGKDSLMCNVHLGGM